MKARFKSVSVGGDLTIGSVDAERPSLRDRFQSSPLADFVNRRTVDECAARIETLAAEGGGGLGAPAPVLLLHGPGGFGKTYVARAVSFREEVRALFPDGILWTTIEKECSRTELAAAISRSLSSWAGREDLPKCKLAHLSDLLTRYLADSRVLWILDDAWDEFVLDIFTKMRHPSMVLVTTRVLGKFPTNVETVQVGSMDESESMALLDRGFDSGRVPEIRTIARKMGGWPLLMSLCNAQLQKWKRHGLDVVSSLNRVEEQLQLERGQPIGSTARNSKRLRSIEKAILSSLSVLAMEDQRAYRKLAILEQRRNVPLSLLQDLWGLDRFRAESLCIRLFECSLIQGLDLGARTFGIHLVFLEYLQNSSRGRLEEDHTELLSNALPATGDWSDLPEDSVYLWKFLFKHLEAAGQTNVQCELLSNFAYLGEKTRLLGPQALLDDFSELPDACHELSILRDAIKRSAHVLVEEPEQLAGQLTGRLECFAHVRLRGLCSEARQVGGRMVPLQGSLTPPGALRQTLNGHDLGIQRILILHSSALMVSTSRDKSARLWNLETGEMVRLFLGHRDFVNGVAQIDDRRIITASEDGSLIVWNLEQGTLERILAGPRTGHLDVAVLDDELVVSASRDGKIRLWNYESGELVRTFEGHKGPATTVDVSKDGYLVSGGADGYIKVWDVQTGRVSRHLVGHEDWVIDVCVLAGRRLASASADGTVRIWHLATGQLQWTLRGHSHAVQSVARLSENLVVSGSRDCTLRLWDIERGELQRVIHSHHESVQAVACPDRTCVVSGSVDRSLRIWDLRKLRSTVPRLPKTRKGIFSLASWQGRCWAAASDDHTVSVWSSVDAEHPMVLSGHGDVVLDVDFLSGNRIITASYDRSLRLWDLATKKTLQVFEGHESEVLSLAVLNRRTFVSGSYDHTIRLWSTKTGKALWVFDGHDYGIQAVERLDGKHFVSASRDKTLRVWDVDTKATVMTLKGHSGGVMAIAKLDERRLVSASRDGTLRLWDLADGWSIRVLTGHKAAIHAVISLASGHLVTASDDRRVCLWDPETGDILDSFHSDWAVRALTLLNPGILVAGDLSGCIHKFDLSELTSIQESIERTAGGKHEAVR